MTKHTEEEKIQAVALARATTYQSAADEYGVAKSTISRWNKAYGDNVPEQGTKRNRVPKKIKEISEEATERAKEEIAEHIAEKGKLLAERLLETAEEARQEVLRAIQAGKTAEEYNSGWLKAVTGAMNYCIKTKNELTGQGGKGGVNISMTQQQVNSQTQEQISEELEGMSKERRINLLRAWRGEFDDPGSGGNGTVGSGG